MDEDKNYDVFMKIILIGDSAVGKSCLLLRFSEDSFTPAWITTIGIDFKIRVVDVDDVKVKLQIIDTAGQERFRTITNAYYRGALGIILVYDIANARSFDSLKFWIRNIQEHASESATVLLVGNKSDMEDQREVKMEQALKFADSHHMKFLETSALSGENVEKAFITIARLVLERGGSSSRLENRLETGSTIALDKKPDAKKKCCTTGA